VVARLEGNYGGEPGGNRATRCRTTVCLKIFESGNFGVVGARTPVPALTNNFATRGDEHSTDTRVYALDWSAQGKLKCATHRVFLLLVKRHNPEFLQIEVIRGEIPARRKIERQVVPVESTC
jgi:hypothetical protein